MRTISPLQFEDYLEKLGKSLYQESVVKGLRKAAARGVAEAQRATTSELVVDRGNYLRSWKAKDLDDGARLYNSAPYSGVVEEGRRPGSRMPPPEVIQRWVKRHAGALGVDGDDDAEVARVAFAIGRKIGREGIKGKHILEDVIEHVLLKHIDGEVKRALQAALETFG